MILEFDWIPRRIFRQHHLSAGPLRFLAAAGLTRSGGWSFRPLRHLYHSTNGLTPWCTGVYIRCMLPPVIKEDVYLRAGLPMSAVVTRAKCLFEHDFTVWPGG
jgi:hypothetical protein